MAIDCAKLLDLFKKLEPLQKRVECLGNGLDGPALNETRNATYHLLKALEGAEQASEIEITKAMRHAQRAIYDCYEAILLHELNKLKIFREEYRNVVVTQVLPEYVQGGQGANKAKSDIDKVRAGSNLSRDDYENGYYSQNRSDIYAQIEPYVAILNEFNNKCEAAREELNKIIRKENSVKRWAMAGKIGTVLVAIAGVVIGIGQWFFPVK